MKRECETCIKRKTLFCPTSIKCMATDDKPYYQNRIMLLEENEELKQQIIIMEKYFELINSISFDYDGYNDVAGLKGVIDELNRFANLGRACNITEPIYESEGVKFNILLQKLPEQKIGDDK